MFLRLLGEAIWREPNDGLSKAIEVAKSAHCSLSPAVERGETVTLTVRMHKFIFLDGLSPRGIFATTFTEEAAQELAPGW
jgi:hypothetical protein